MITLCGFKGKGFQQKDLVQLKAIPITPRGDRSDRWQGIQHGALVETLHKVLKDEFDAIPMNEQYFLSPNNACTIGAFELGHPVKQKRGSRNEIIESLPGTGTSIAFIHANDSSKSLRLLAGGRVFLCSNGVVVSEVHFRRRHTTGLSLRDWLTDNLTNFLPDLTRTLSERLEPLRNHSLEPSQHDALLLASARQNILPWKMLADADAHWFRAVSGQSLGWVAEDDQDKWEFRHNAWDWYGMLSHVCKTLPPQQQLVSLQRGLDLVTAL